MRRPLLGAGLTRRSHWASAKEPAALSEKAIDSWLSNHTKGGALRSSYELAKDPEEWEQETIKKQRIALERAANEDELDDEDDDDEAAETGKKRKRAPVKPKAGASKSSKKVKTEAGPSKKKAKGDDEKKKAAKPGDGAAHGCVSSLTVRRRGRGSQAVPRVAQQAPEGVPRRCGQVAQGRGAAALLR